jgi:hypothetical protein
MSCLLGMRSNKRALAAQHGDVLCKRPGDYVLDLPLVLDPTVQFSSYRGGTGDDYAYGVAIDEDGYA